MAWVISEMAGNDQAILPFFNTLLHSVAHNRVLKRCGSIPISVTRHDFICAEDVALSAEQVQAWNVLFPCGSNQCILALCGARLIAARQYSGEMEEAMIKINSLTKRFGEHVAVDNLSFDVKPGEVLGFLGPNGAGKSTTMKMLTGFLTPDGGSASVCGFDIRTQILQAQQQMGYLPEGAPCYGDMRVKGFLEFIAEVRGLRGADRQRHVARAVEQVELQAVLGQTIDTLSKGFKRRVGLAQAILHDPQVLILDEPTDGLDPNQKHQVRNLIQQLASGSNKIVVISTHILEEVSAVCSRTVVISRGRLLADGTPEELEARSTYHQAVTVLLQQPVDSQPLLALPGVKAVEVAREGHQLTVIAEPGAVIFPAIGEYARQQQWQVKELSVERGRLDDVFRRLTAEEAA
ncbi:ABC-2 type transport system ATP-binding protein [Halopseudomonas litoralis]|uniref:ABC-2 type transport system ATP-binding protein n=2 Tax=Halopseudomonas litoralis TaxID=797277 RepID=A0A1H1M0I6_9GAMM|nr:ABC-2 type transport system ATP-binding protein [Halopseudomonas litoralis]